MTSDIDIIPQKRAIAQSSLDRKTASHRNTPYREQPYDHPAIQKTKPFFQYPKSNSKILSDDTNEDDIPH